MTMKRFALPLLLILPTITYSQDYLITTKGDTLTGKITLNYYDLIDRAEIRSDKKKTSLIATKVREAVVDGAIYRPQKLNERYRFMKLMKSGYLSLYGFRAQGQSTFESQFLAKLDGHSIEVPHLSFKSVMSSFLKDCPELADRIEHGEKGLGKKNLEKIVDEYNECIGQRKSHTIEVAQDSSALTPQLKSLEELKKKVQDTADLPNKQDAIDLLNDIGAKLKADQAIPNYLITGLESYLANTPLKTDLDNFIELLTHN